MSEKSAEFADRVWLAYWSLPRTRHDRPETFHRIEHKHGVSNGALGNIVSGKQKTVTAPTLMKIATALNVSPSWLLSGEGEAPTPTGHVPPRTEEATAQADESGENSTLRVTVAADVERASHAALDRALHEAPPDATPAQVLTLALVHVTGARPKS